MKIQIKKNLHVQRNLLICLLTILSILPFINITADVYAESASVPTAIFSPKHGTAQYINGVTYTNSVDFTFVLSSNSSVDRYKMKYWTEIQGSKITVDKPWSLNNLNGYSSSLGVYNDKFTQGEGVHYFAFSACTKTSCSEYAEPFKVIYDKTAPTGLVNISSMNDNKIVAPELTFAWSKATDVNDVTYYFEYSNSDALSSDGSLLEPGYRSDPLTDLQLSNLDLSDGIYFWHVRAVDAAGNSTPWTTLSKVEIYSVVPPVISDSEPDSNTLEPSNEQEAPAVEEVEAVITATETSTNVSEEDNTGVVEGASDSNQDNAATAVLDNSEAQTDAATTGGSANNQTAVLGTQTSTPSENQTNIKSNLVNIIWRWCLALIASIVFIIWLIVAKVRRDKTL